MYHNWYELYLIGRQTQKELHRRADQVRRADDAHRVRKEQRKQACARRSGHPGPTLNRP